MANKEYIERNTIIEMLEESLEDKKRWLKKATDFVNIYVAKNDIKQLNFAMTCAKALLADIPSVDVEPVKHGHWEWGDIYDDGDVCSACNYDSHREPCKYKYCPNCGAKMDGREKDDGKDTKIL